MLIGMFGFYQTWLQNYEVRISPWRKLQSLQPKPSLVSISDEAELLSAHWDNSCQKLLSELKEEILFGPVLARPDPNRRFYIKTDWSRLGMGTVLLQANSWIQPPWTKHTSDSPGKYNNAKPSQAVTLHPRRRILKSQLRSLIGR